MLGVLTVAVGGALGGGWLRRRARRAVRGVRRDHRSRIDHFKLTSKKAIRRALFEDAEVTAAAIAHMRETSASEEETWAKVHEYVEEIVPSFSLLSYYRLGYATARLLLPLLYKVSVGYEASEALAALPRDSVIHYLMNHRSNADYMVVAYVLSGRVAISYAVGEWARIWPLEVLFKSFGSYFVRRRYREALYHQILERYVQLITSNGVTQGIFLEGGLSRDGRPRDPKLGLLDYVIGVKRDPDFRPPLFVIPVAINYDRVLEDRSLLREAQAPEERMARRQQVFEVASYVVKVSTRFVLRRAKRYGRACVNFGAPLSVDAWLAENPGVLALPRDERLERLKGLADQVMRAIASVMPVTAVCLASTALLRHPDEFISRRHFETLLGELRLVLRGAGAHVIGDGRESGEILDRALVMLALRHIVTPEGDGFRIDRSQAPLLRFYANAIAHFFEAPALGS